MATTIKFDVTNVTSGVVRGSGWNAFGTNTDTAGSILINANADVKFTFSTAGIAALDLSGSDDFLGSFGSPFFLDLVSHTGGASPLTNPFFATGTLTGIVYGGGAHWTVTFLDMSGATISNVSLKKLPTTVPLAPSTYSIRFTENASSGGGIGIGGITGDIQCFLAGTAIATDTGEVPVETLRPGDRLRTAGGGFAIVAWLGEMPVDTRLTHPAKVNPVCIRADALADGLPARDLMLSPDHAVEIDGMLYNAGALVNGQTIYRVPKMPLDGFTYYHVELEEGHRLILAEGVPAESYIDYAPAECFENGAEREQRTIAEMPLARVSAPRLVSDSLRTRLAERSGLSILSLAS